MRKKTKALSGASQDAYFRRVLKAYSGRSPEERERMVRQLREEIAQLRVRLPPRDAKIPHQDQSPRPSVTIGSTSEKPAPAFDPFSPNVVVVLRTSGRDAALAALATIESPENLRRLAREQRLNFGGDFSSAADLRAAIVAAAERRIANRLAAAS
jgi:hypothetical protein